MPGADPAGSPPPLAPPVRAAGKASPAEVAALVAITLAGAVWRAATLGSESLWIDEGTSIHLARLSPAEIVADRAKDGHTPPYFLLLHLWVRLFGDSPEAVRALSVVPGTLVIPLLYLAAARWRGPVAGLLAAAMAAGSRYLAYYAQEARDYSFLVLFGCAAFWTLDRALERRSPGRLLAWAAALSATLWTSVFGMIVLATQALYLAGRGIASRPRGPGAAGATWRAAWPFALAAGAALLSFSPWLAVLSKRAETAHTLWMKEPPAVSIVTTVRAFAGSWRGLALLGPALLVGTWVAVGPRTPDRRRGWLFAAWVAGPILLLWALSYVSFPIFVRRGTIVATGGFFVLAAAGLDALRPRRALFVAAALAAAAGLAFGVWRHEDRRDKEDWRALAALVEAKAEPGAIVLVRGRDELVTYTTYAKRRDLLVAVHADAAEGRIVWGEAHSVFLVASAHVHIYRRIDDARAALLAAGFALLSTDRAPQIDVEVYGVR